MLNNFFARYDTLLREHKGKLSIVHIGGSHVQAGVLTDQIRFNLNMLVLYLVAGFWLGGRAFVRLRQ